jgi:1,2-diacylglycerol 3-alpha-glucosyltransferase
MGWKESDLIVLSVGRIAPEKNPLALIEAFSRTTDRCPRAILAVVGEGPWREKVQKLIRQKGLESRVRMLGERSPAEAAACFAASDLFVLASFNETQGLVLGEAMSYGLPVVAAQGGAATTTFTDGKEGFAVLPDPDSIAEAMTSLLLKPSLRDQMGQAAQARGRSWTCLAHARAVEEVYREVLGQDTLGSQKRVELNGLATSKMAK